MIREKRDIEDFQPGGRYDTKGGMQEDEYVDEGERTFGGFGMATTALHKRMLTLERKVDKWIKESMGIKENEDQDRECQKNLKERIRRVEENEARLIAENEELKKELAKYKKQLEEGLGKVEKEKENLKDLVNKEEERVQDVIKKEVYAWNVQDKKDKDNFQGVIQEQLKERDENMAKKMVGVLKEKENLVRKIAEKKECNHLWTERK
ncbi:hypothetical protein E2C01_039145 [Portunus trituberculatus]|uniref:Uncharacterized protein n=1 Tax=Portunus trituberculatus TaxID=210409 RepID=A0A5B7FJ29_PORTR|nr:hypothetical protein [Portunus trituberculatus]